MRKINEIINGLNAIARIDEARLDGDAFCVSVGHDTIFAGDRTTKDKMPREDLEQLESMGWVFDEQYDCFCKYV